MRPGFRRLSTDNAPKAHYCPWVPVAVVSVEGGGVGGGGASFGFGSADGGAVAVVVGAFASGAAVEVESDVELDDIGAADGSVRVSVVFTGVGFGSAYEGGGVVGKELATVLGAVDVAVGAAFGSVKFVVVSAAVSVIGGIVDGAGVSPGAVIVEVDPLADPSCTTSYCCWPRCIVPVLRLQARARATIRSIRLRFI